MKKYFYQILLVGTLFIQCTEVDALEKANITLSSSYTNSAIREDAKAYLQVYQTPLTLRDKLDAKVLQSAKVFEDYLMFQMRNANPDWFNDCEKIHTPTPRDQWIAEVAQTLAKVPFDLDDRPDVVLATAVLGRCIHTMVKS